MEETISLKEIYQILVKRMKLIVITVLILLTFGAVFTFFLVTPQYEASTQILINQAQNNDQSITSDELQSNRELINTYNVIMTSPIILEVVIERLELDRSVSQLQEQISVAAEEESQVVVLSVEDENPQAASDLANTTALVFEEEVTNIMNIDNVSILSSANASESAAPVSPQPVLNLAISLLVGLILGIGLALLLEFLDQTVKTEQDVEKVLNIPILGSISVISQEDGLNNINTDQKNSKNRFTEKKSRKSS